MSDVVAHESGNEELVPRELERLSLINVGLVLFSRGVLVLKGCGTATVNKGEDESGIAVSG